MANANNTSLAERHELICNCGNYPRCGIDRFFPNRPGKLAIASYEGKRYAIDVRMQELRNEDDPIRDVLRFSSFKDFCEFIADVEVIEPRINY